MRILKKKKKSAEQTARKQGKFGLKWRADAIEERRGRDHERIGLVVEAKFPELEVVEFDQSVRGERARIKVVMLKKKDIFLVP